MCSFGASTDYHYNCQSSPSIAVLFSQFTNIGKISLHSQTLGLILCLGLGSQLVTDKVMFGMIFRFSLDGGSLYQYSRGVRREIFLLYSI